MRVIPCRGYKALNPEGIPLESDPEETLTVEEVSDASAGCSRPMRSGVAIIFCVSAYAMVYSNLHWAFLEAGQEQTTNGAFSDTDDSPVSFSGEVPAPAEASPANARDTLLSPLQTSREWPVPPPEWRLPRLPRPGFNASTVSRPTRDTGPPTTAASLNARFHRNPWDVFWPADGSLADAGLLIHVTRNEHGHVRVASYEHTQGNMCTTMVYASLREAGVERMPLFDGGLSGVVFRPGVAQIVCGKPHDSGGTCGHRCKPDGFIQACTWLPNETGYYLKKVLEQKINARQYNEIMVNTSYWPSNIIEASFGDPVLPPPHFHFDPGNWVSPFTEATPSRWGGYY